MPSETEYTVLGVKFDDKSGWPIIVLRDVDNGRCFGIAVSASNLLPVLRATDPEKWPNCGGRPGTHDFTLALAGTGGVRIERLVIDRLTERGVFTAALEVHSSGGEVVRLDARPSDAIPVALAAGAPVFVADDVAAKVTYYSVEKLPYRDIESKDVPGL